MNHDAADRVVLRGRDSDPAAALSGSNLKAPGSAGGSLLSQSSVPPSLAAPAICNWGVTVIMKSRSVMMVTVKNKIRTPLVVPPSVRRKAGHRNGDDLEFRVSGGVITIVPKLQAADDEYTPEQRRVIDAQLAGGLEDIKAGRTFGPFDSADEMIAHMKAQLKKKVAVPKTKRSR
jgi:bifunctional DNA-binding transcriptional regulator/antitoxin component of YhaV-PrlF toxin-antitoxin module